MGRQSHEHASRQMGIENYTMEGFDLVLRSVLETITDTARETCEVRGRPETIRLDGQLEIMARKCPKLQVLA
jgi:hypothetical protein